MILVYPYSKKPSDQNPRAFDVRAGLASQGAAAYLSTPDQFAVLMNAHIAKLARVISSTAQQWARQWR